MVSTAQVAHVHVPSCQIIILSSALVGYQFLPEVPTVGMTDDEQLHVM